MPRIIDKSLLKQIKSRPCVISKCNRRDIDPCHIKTRGSGGDDVEENVISMCRAHHIEQTQKGWARFCEKHPEAYKELLSRGWKLVDEFGVIKLRRIDENAFS